MPREILIADNEGSLMEVLSSHLEREQFDVRFTRSGKRTLILAQDGPALVLLGRDLEDVSGVEVCRLLRAAPATAKLPIIIVSTNDEQGDRLLAFEAGADDYVLRPIDPRELLARIRAVLRRSQPADGGEILKTGDMELDKASHVVKRRGRRLNLAATEFRLVEAFMRNSGRVLSREQLLEIVWRHHSHIGIRTVDAHIRRLRQALLIDGAPDPIRTVRSAGYSLDFES